MFAWAHYSVIFVATHLQYTILCSDGQNIWCYPCSSQSLSPTGWPSSFQFSVPRNDNTYITPTSSMSKMGKAKCILYNNYIYSYILFSQFLWCTRNISKQWDKIGSCMLTHEPFIIYAWKTSSDGPHFPWNKVDRMLEQRVDFKTLRVAE